VTPARLVERWRDDRFVRPAAADPRRLAQATARLWELLPPSVVGLELSPVTPLGTCSAVAPVDQHRVVSTVRGSEVVSDPTNVLALEAARRRRSGEPRVDLAAAHRVLRGQVFHDPEAYSHFLLFVLVSSGRDRGDLRTEQDLLRSHLDWWRAAVSTLAPGVSAVAALTAFDPAVRPVVTVAVEAGSDPTMAVVEDAARTRAAVYYPRLALRLELAGEEIGDGGFVPWTATLMNDAKERCRISCVSVERLVQLSSGGPARSARPR